MKLHEAIIEVLTQSKQPLTCSEIAAKINSLKLYVKRNGNPITGTQVHARINRYTYVSLFNIDKSSYPLIVSLRKKDNIE